MISGTLNSSSRKMPGAQLREISLTVAWKDIFCRKDIGRELRNS